MTRSFKHLILGLLLIAATAPGRPAQAQPGFELLKLPMQCRWADFALDHTGSAMACNLDGAIYAWSEDDGFDLLLEGPVGGGSIGLADGGSATLGETIEPGAAGQSIWFTSAENQRRDISADGRVKIGFSLHPATGDKRPTRWLGGAEADHFLGPNRTGEAAEISADGTRIVGQADLQGPRVQAFYWREGRPPVNLGHLGGASSGTSLAHAISETDVVVGSSGDPFWGVQRAFLWTADSGMRPLAEILHEAGIDLPRGVEITEALDISGDGSTIVGAGRDGSRQPCYWLARIDGIVVAPASHLAPAGDRRQAATRDSLGLQEAGMMEMFPFPPTRRNPPEAR